MISNMNIPFQFEKDMLGIAQEHIKNTPSVGDLLKVYLPLLMIDINKNVGNEIISTPNYQIFLNDETCRPSIQTIIKTQDYLTAKLENNTDWVNNIGQAKDKNKWIYIVKNIRRIISESRAKYLNPMYTNITFNNKTIKMRTDCFGYIAACLSFYNMDENETPIIINKELAESNGIMKTYYGFSHKEFTGWESCKSGDIIGGLSHVEIFSHIENKIPYVYTLNNDDLSNSGTSISSVPSNSLAKEKYEYIWSPNENNNRINIGDKVVCHAPNGKLSKLLFNNSKYIE